MDALQKPREHCQSSKGKCQKKIIKNDCKLEKHRLDYGRLQDGIKGVGERDMVDGMIGEEVNSLGTLCGYVLYSTEPLSAIWVWRCPKTDPSTGGTGPPPKTHFQGPTRVHNPSSILISSSVFAELSVVSNRQTDTQTQRPCYSVIKNDCRAQNTDSISDACKTESKLLANAT